MGKVGEGKLTGGWVNTGDTLIRKLGIAHRFKGLKKLHHQGIRKKITLLLTFSELLNRSNLAALSFGTHQMNRYHPAAEDSSLALKEIALPA